MRRVNIYFRVLGVGSRAPHSRSALRTRAGYGLKNARAVLDLDLTYIGRFTAYRL